MVSSSRIATPGFDHSRGQEGCSKRIPVEKALLYINSLPKSWFPGKSFSEIRKTLAQREGTLSDFVMELARTYKIISPMPGVLPSSPLKRKRRSFEDENNQESITPVSQQVGDEISPRQREAAIYCGKVKLNKMKKFTEDSMLNRIRLNRSLNHTMISVGNSARCMLCSGGRKGQHTTSFVCKTCNVRLCIRARDGRQRTCADRFHLIDDPKHLFN